MSIHHSSTNSEASNDDEWLDVDQDDREHSTPVVSLLDDRVFPDAASMLLHCREEHHFDFQYLRDRLALDFYGSIRLINFIRKRVRDGVSLPKDIAASDFESDVYLKPVLEDDGLILCLDDLPQSSAPAAAADNAKDILGPTGELLERNATLQAKLDQLASQFASYRLAVQQTLDDRWGDDDSRSSPSSKEPASRPDQYFESYAHNDIHETMLKDSVRTDAYRDFIYNNKHLFAGKVVLDLGCGTGILSMFCARAGASHVFAVDRSAIIDKARENVFTNGLDHKITCLRGMIEDVKLPVDQVDIIVSEWMGYCLLYEAMLPSVLWARDRYLKADGLLVPSHAALWIAPFSSPDYLCDYIAFWRDVYGFDMKAMQAGIYNDVRVETMPNSTVCGAPFMFRHLDLYTVSKEQLVFTANWNTSMNPSVDSLDGFLVWFDIYFAPSRDEDAAPANATATASAKEWQVQGADRIAFTTGPDGKETHWKQCLLLSKWSSKPSESSTDPSITGIISFSSPENDARALNLRMEWTMQPGQEYSQSWALT